MTPEKALAETWLEFKIRWGPVQPPHVEILRSLNLEADIAEAKAACEARRLACERHPWEQTP